tara:strand:+ start:1126 stop:1932 length:807 start_codon:yes stop_codon:yes gene_type:complete
LSSILKKHLFSQFDNSVSDTKPVAPSFLYSVNGDRILYTYIRKNACTAFKYLFREIYQPWQEPVYEPLIGELNKAIAVRQDDIEAGKVGYDASLFVYRDPSERAISAFKNKLIQQSGADDFIRTVEVFYDKPFGEISFASFVTDYLAALTTDNWKAVDGHMYPQRWHLLPIKYTHVIEMGLLYEGMLELLPWELADKVFGTPANKTREKPTHMADVDSTTPVSELVSIYNDTGFMPKKADILTDELEAELRKIYREDYEMLENMKGGS